MYSDEEQKLIKKYEIDSFKKIKEKEKSKVITSNDLLYTSDFDFELFSSKGDSGELFFAINKYNKNEKYIIKHEYYDSACNEYIYSKIGNKMGVKIADVKLFIINDKENIFKSPFVCGINYLENGFHISYNDIIKNEISNWQDFFRMRALESLFMESDGIEVIKCNKEIYRIDTTDAFTISDFHIAYVAYNVNKFILRSADLNVDEIISMWEIELKSFVKNYGKEYFAIYLDTFKSFLKVKTEDIEEWIDILTVLYPNVIGDYFRNYFKNLKVIVNKFLKSNFNLS